VLAGWGLVPFWLKPEQASPEALRHDQRPFRIAIQNRADLFASPFKKAPLHRAERAGLVRVAEDRAQKTQAALPTSHTKAAPFAFRRRLRCLEGPMAAGRSRALPSSPNRRGTEHTAVPRDPHGRWCWRSRKFDDWMRGPPEIAAGMMKPYGGAIEAWEVGAEVGNVKNNRPALMERVGLFFELSLLASAFDRDASRLVLFAPV